MTDTSKPDVLYTIVDEAPELASASLLPIVRAFAAAADLNVGTKDISLAGRIIATFPESLTDAQRQSDDLANLGELVKTPEAMSSSCQTSLPPYLSCKPLSRNCKPRATRCRTIRKTQQPTKKKRSALVLTASKGLR